MVSRRVLDQKDLAILKNLQSEGRISYSELGRRVNLSQPSISERVSRLEDDGIITGFTVSIDSRKLGYRLSAIVHLATSHEHIATCLEHFKNIPNITEIARVTGPDCFILKVIFKEPEELEGLVDRIALFGPVKTAVVLRSEVMSVPLGGSRIGLG